MAPSQLLQTTELKTDPLNAATQIQSNGAPIGLLYKAFFETNPKYAGANMPKKVQTDAGNAILWKLKLIKY